MDDPLMYVALGDSITNGRNVRKIQRYPSILTRWLAQYFHQPVYGRNWGKNGMSSSAFLNQLQSPRVFQTVRQAQFVTVCIGGNDLIYAYIKWRLWRNDTYLDEAVHTFSRNFHRICEQLHWLARGNVVFGTFYNPFPLTPLAVETVEFCNYGVIRPTAERYGFPVADLYASFRGRESILLENYRTGRLEEYRPWSRRSPVHPNVDGYYAIARCFARELLK